MNNPAVVPFDPHLARETDSIRVFLGECTVELNIGIYAHEKRAPQTVTIGVEVEAALPHRYQDPAESSLDRIINYERFYYFIREDLPRMQHTPLLETVAERIVTFCFEDCRIRAVRVRIEKPHVFAGSARPGIEICRTRRDSQT